MSNQDKYNDVFARTFLINIDELNNLSYHSVTVWDSIGHMLLISAMEEEFDIMIDSEDIFEFSSYEKGKEILKKYSIEI